MELGSFPAPPETVAETVQGRAKAAANPLRAGSRETSSKGTLLLLRGLLVGRCRDWLVTLASGNPLASGNQRLFIVGHVGFLADPFRNAKGGLPLESHA